MAKVVRSDTRVALATFEYGETQISVRTEHSKSSLMREGEWFYNPDRHAGSELVNLTEPLDELPDEVVNGSHNEEDVCDTGANRYVAVTLNPATGWYGGISGMYACVHSRDDDLGSTEFSRRRTQFRVSDIRMSFSSRSAMGMNTKDLFPIIRNLGLMIKTLREAKAEIESSDVEEMIAENNRIREEARAAADSLRSAGYSVSPPVEKLGGHCFTIRTFHDGYDRSGVNIIFSVNVDIIPDDQLAMMLGALPMGNKNVLLNAYVKFNCTFVPIGVSIEEAITTLKLMIKAFCRCCIISEYGSPVKGSSEVNIRGEVNEEVESLIRFGGDAIMKEVSGMIRNREDGEY